MKTNQAEAVKPVEENKLQTNYQSVKGNLISVPEIKVLDSGLKVANFSIKQSYPVGKPKEGEKQEFVNNYHNIVAFGKQAELVEKAGLKKGEFVEAEGKSNFYSFEKEGVDGKNYSNKLVTSNVQKLEKGIKPFQNTNNHIELRGNLVSDPEIKTLPGGKKIVNISLAHNYKSKGQENEVMYVNATIYNKEAVDYIEKNKLEKGSTVSLKGSVEPKVYTDKNNNQRYSVSINSNFVHLDKSKEPVVDQTNIQAPEAIKEANKKVSSKKTTEESKAASTETNKTAAKKNSAKKDEGMVK